MEQLKLNMIPNGVNPVFHASQYDKGRQIRFVLDETLSGAEVTTLYRAKDGTEHGNVQMSVSGNTITDTIPEEVLTDYGIIEGEVNIDGIGSLNFFVEVEKDAYDGGVITTQTATGAIATFSTNIETAFASLKSDINPVQDLHGYSKPWSGGGGKNKLENTSTVATLYGVTFSKNDDGSVKLTGTSTGSGTGTYITFFTLPSGTYIFTDGSTSTNYYMFLMVEGDGTWYKNGMSFTVDGNTRTRIVMYIANGTATNTTLYPMIRLASVLDASFEPYENICPISGFSTLNVTLADGDMQTVESKTVNFGQTVYGGVADATGGKVTVNKNGVDLGSLNWSYITSGTVPRFQAPLPTTGKGSVDNAHEANLICSNYANTSWANVTNLLAYNGYIAEVNNGGFITIHDDNYTDAPTFKTAMSGVMIVYELATPTEITTTPENLTALSGQTNNVYSDTNGDTTVEYYIEV